MIDKKNIEKKYLADVYGNKKVFKIYVDIEKFIPNASSLVYAGDKNAIIAWSEIDEYEIVVEAVGDVRMYDSNSDIYYTNEIPEYAKSVLITEENIENYGYNVDESNCFEIRYLKKRKDKTYEYYGGSDEIFTELDSTPEQLMDVLYTETIVFLQSIL